MPSILRLGVPEAISNSKIPIFSVISYLEVEIKLFIVHLGHEAGVLVLFAPCFAVLYLPIKLEISACICRFFCKR